MTIREQLNARAEDLAQDFRQHWQECLVQHPEMIDRHKVFEGWAIQRIAGLEHLLLEIIERNHLTTPAQ